MSTNIGTCCCQATCCGCSAYPTQWNINPTGIQGNACVSGDCENLNEADAMHPVVLTFRSADPGCAALGITNQDDTCYWCWAEANAVCVATGRWNWYMACDSTYMWLHAAMRSDIVLGVDHLASYRVLLSLWDCLLGGTLTLVAHDDAQCNGWPAAIRATPH